MKQIYIIGQYQLVRFLRNKLMVSSLLFFFILCIFSLFYGKKFVEKQEKVIYPIDTLNQKRDIETKALLSELEDSVLTEKQQYFALTLAQRKGNTAIYRPTAFSSFSIGQKDNYPYYKKISFGNNVYDVEVSEIQNPDKLQVGNFDLSFMFIYLAPLLIIALGYNALSGEEDNNTIRLLKMQVSESKIIAGKLLFLFAILTIAATVASFTGFYLNDMNIHEHGSKLIVWLLISYSYFFFWIGIVAFVISFKANSSINALVLGSIWIISLLLVPSIVHREVTSSKDNQLVDILLNKRGDGVNILEIPKEKLVDTMYTMSHPYAIDLDSSVSTQIIQLAAGTEIRTRENNSLGRAIVDKQQKEYEKAEGFNIINPGYTIQNAYNRLAGTEIENYHDYLLAAEEYQTRMRYLIYDYMFRPRKFTLADYEAFPVFTYQQLQFTWKACIQALSPIYLLSLLLYVGSGLVIWRQVKD
ncbi:MAG: ABC transporter permease subunit [Cytophagales bacterium]|nr:ABC transporter permease subunit [Cytophagales bacterium]